MTGSQIQLIDHSLCWNIMEFSSLIEKISFYEKLFNRYYCSSYPLEHYLSALMFKIGETNLWASNFSSIVHHLEINCGPKLNLMYLYLNFQRASIVVALSDWKDFILKDWEVVVFSSWVIFSVIGIHLSPLLSFLASTIWVGFEVFCNRFIKRIVEICGRHQCLDREENSSDLKSWGPFVLEDIKADSSKLINIWMVDLGSEKNLWCNHWILVGQEKFTLEKTSSIKWIFWSSKLDEEVSEVLLVWLGIDSNNWILGKSLSFFENSWWNWHFVVFK